MGRKRELGALKGNVTLCQSATLREHNTGIKQVDVTSVQTTQHLQRLATWASREARIAPLAAFLGERLAAKAEASGISLDSSTFLCQRCETILDPGINCTVRIEKNANRSKQLKKSHTLCQNNVVYTCHFCSHRNLKRGTAKGHVRGLLASRHCLTSNSSSYRSTKVEKDKPEKESSATEVLQQNGGGQILSVKEPLSELKPFTPEKDAAARSATVKSPVRLMNLGSKSNKRKVSGSKPIIIPISGNNLAISDSENTTRGSSRRRRKGWSSLKEMVESNESNDKIISNISIPFLI